MFDEKNVRIAIVGIGGIGGYFSTKLVNRYSGDQNVSIVFIQRGAHLQAIQQKGLLYITRDHTYTVIPDLATESPDTTDPFNLVLFCVKSYDLEASASVIKPHTAQEAVILSALNGVDIDQRLRAIFPDHPVLPGAIYISAAIEKPGVIRQHGGVGSFIFGPVSGETEPFRSIEHWFKSSGIKARLDPQITVRLWEKYIFVCALASMTSLDNRPIGSLVRDAASRERFIGLIREISLIGLSQGVQIPENIVDMCLERIAMVPYDSRTSMQRDIAKGKRSEISIFTEYVVNAGKALGIETPFHDRILSELQLKIRSGRSLDTVD